MHQPSSTPTTQRCTLAAVGWYERHVFPTLMDALLANRRLISLRQELLSGLRGRVLEIGFGTGLNAAHYPDTVEELIALEPNEGMNKKALARVTARGLPFRAVAARGEQIPLPDASVDAVVSTFTLCSIAGLDGAFAEIRRVLRPGAALHLIEHGRHPDAAVQRWQRTMRPLNLHFGCGCHLDRDIAGCVAGAGFHMEPIREFDVLTKIFMHLTMATAHPRSLATDRGLRRLAPPGLAVAWSPSPSDTPSSTSSTRRVARSAPSRAPS